MRDIVILFSVRTGVLGQGARLYITLHYTEYRVGLSSVERFFNQPELPLEGRIVFQPQTKTANGDADRVMV